MDKPILDYFSHSKLLKEQICCPFKLTKREESKRVWTTSHQSFKNMVTINIQFVGPDEQMSLLLYTDDGLMLFSVAKDRFKALTISNLFAIEILTPLEQVTGMIDMQITHKEESDIYF